MYTFWSSTTVQVQYSLQLQYPVYTSTSTHTRVPKFQKQYQYTCHSSTRVYRYIFIIFTEGIKKPSKLCRRIPLVIVMCGTQSFLSSLNRTTAQETLSNRPPPPPIIACSCSVACGHLAPNRPTTNPSLPHSHKRR